MSSPIRIGKKKDDKKNWAYKDAEYDPEGWCDIRKYLPEEYDLCLLKTEVKTRKGWWTGTGWDGAFIGGETILYWKKFPENMTNFL